MLDEGFSCSVFVLVNSHPSHPPLSFVAFLAPFYILLCTIRALFSSIYCPFFRLHYLIFDTSIFFTLSCHASHLRIPFYIIYVLVIPDIQRSILLLKQRTFCHILAFYTQDPRPKFFQTKRYFGFGNSFQTNFINSTYQWFSLGLLIGFKIIFWCLVT